MKKIVFFDVDDTLIHHRGDISYIPTNTKKSIEKLKENGHIVAIASGRAYWQIKPIMEHLGVENAVCINGHMLVVGNKIVKRHILDKEELKKVFKMINPFKLMPVVAFTENEVLLKDYFGKVRKKLIGSVRPLEFETEEYFTSALRKFKKQDLDYFLVMLINKKLKFKDEYKKLEFKPWGDIAYEVACKGISKYSGIVELTKHFNIDDENIYAFGDNYNDIEMLKGVQHGVAMGNSIEELKKVADYVTDSVENNGIEKACIHYKLI